ncbi:hypothetical protein N431DRAFT_481863 [Stipitochalara longipes BDJ]|nr:hypothetical protein N431DRAFT_481863 [Stipitochalara longipes BDJ]
MLLPTIIVLLSSRLAAAAGSPCSKFPYAELLFLSAYPPAESYCSAHYPDPTKTITTTFTAPGRKARRTPGPDPTRAPVVPPGNPIWSSLVAEGGSLVSTFCSCIEAQPTVTVTSTTTSCSYPSATIAAAPCTTVTGDDGLGDTVGYTEFASNQGATQPLDGSETGGAGDGSTSACDAIANCANSASGEDANGFIVAYHTDSNFWICQIIVSEMPFSNTNCYIKAAYGYIRSSSIGKEK